MCEVTLRLSESWELDINIHQHPSVLSSYPFLHCIPQNHSWVGRSSGGHWSHPAQAVLLVRNPSCLPFLAVSAPRHRVWILGGPVWSRELDSMQLMGPFQLGISWNPMINETRRGVDSACWKAQPESQDRGSDERKAFQTWERRGKAEPLMPVLRSPWVCALQLQSGDVLSIHTWACLGNESKSHPTLVCLGLKRAIIATHIILYHELVIYCAVLAIRATARGC